VLLALFGLLVGSQPVGAQLRGDVVRTVRFEGNSTFPSDSLARAIVTKETECRTNVLVLFCALGFDFALRRPRLRVREVPRDQTRLTIWYYIRGFREVQVDTPSVVRSPGQVDVTFRIVEGRPFLAASIAFEGAEAFVDTGLLDDLPLQPGDRLSESARAATSDTIARRLQNQGYALADIFSTVIYPAEDRYNARVAFEIVPGPLTTYGAIDIQGLENLSAATIRRTLQFSTGDLYRARDVEEARARLFGLDIVRSAQVLPSLDSISGSIVPVTVLVQEGDAYRVRAGGGLSSAECLNLEARWASRNFLGGGRVLQVRARVGNLLAPALGSVLCYDSGIDDFAGLTGLAAVDLAQPWIFSTHNSFATSVFVERQVLPDIFIRRAIGFQAALTRAIDRQTAVTFFYRPELSELDGDDVLFCTGFLVCTPEDIAVLKGANWLAPIGISLARDRSDDLLNPRTGYRFSFDLEHAAAWTGSDFRYERAVAEATVYRELGGPVVLATRLRGGWVGGAFDFLQRPDAKIVHPQRRFFAGGANSVRGFDQSRLGPTVLFVSETELLLLPESMGGAGCSPAAVMDLSCDAGVAPDGVFSLLPTGGTQVIEGNVEVRFPLGSWLEGVAFTDFGQVWSQSPGQGVDLGDIEFTPGFGVRFPSPVGPIRVDLAYRPKGLPGLDVITRQIEAYIPGVHDAEDQLMAPGRIPFVLASQLVRLDPKVFLDGDSRFALHISIGQAF